ncbi:MAG: hypothetical protein R6V26_08870 [Roseovarius sp.]
MPMKSDDHDHAALEAFFHAARRTAPAPSEDMLARVLADAETVRTAAQVRRPGTARRARLRDRLGGWPAMAGLATATLAGLWIGAALPARITGDDAPAYIVDITPEMAFDLAGGGY